MKLLFVIIVFLISNLTHAFSISEVKTKSEDSPALSMLVDKYCALYNQNKLSKAGMVLQVALSKAPNDPTINLLLGKHFENIGFYKYPYMCNYYLKYLTLTKFKGFYADEVIYRLSEFFISESVRRCNEHVVIVDDLRGSPSSLNLFQLLNHIKDKSNPLFNLYYGLLNSVVGNYEEALKKLSAVPLDKIPYDQSRWLYNDLGYTLIKRGRLDEAEHALNIAVFIDPANKFAHANLGQILFIRGNYSKALVEYRKSLAIDSNYKTGLTGVQDCRDRIESINKMKR